MVEHQPYGSWLSPIPAEMLVAGAARLSEVFAEDGVTWWSEGRPAEGGREQIVRRDRDGSVHEVLPEGFGARTRVHEYGGGAWWVDRGVVFFANWADQRLYRLGPDDAEPVALTPAPASRHALRYADGRVTPDGRHLVVVRERHPVSPDVGEARNEVVALAARPTDGDRIAEPVVLVTGPDFVAAPRVSPDGRRLAWLAWDHPDMPWDATRLWVGDLTVDGGGRLAVVNATLWAGGPDESLVQPEWGPDGTLHVGSDRTGWWNVYRVTAPGELEPVCPVEAEVGLPAWGFGQSRYAIGADGTVWFTVSDDDGAHLVRVPAPGGPDTEPTDQLLDATALAPLRLDGDRIVALAGEATREPSIIELTPGTPLTARVLRAPRDLGLPEGSLSLARRIDVLGSGGRTVHAWFYPPAGDGVNGPHGELPPLVVMIHGGPTSAADPSFRLNVQFWTTRGFAVADVDYGGSTGYGRAYRRLLDGAWGVVDVEDACAVARGLAEQGLVDGARMAIRGGSAGGLTTLMALATTDVFSAGASHYGVTDLAALARDTHKFESRYLDRLVGPWPAAADVYAERSPLSHLAGLTAPLIVLQGLDDEVVPPSQAEQVVAGLRDRGVPYAYLTFPGEGHGFRDAANIVRAITAELSFYAQVFGFTLPDDDDPVQIHHAAALPSAHRAE